MYDMKPMAESLASQGRYGDSMLVHMNPIEVAGLRAAAQKMGGDLTTNPQTGQPEAFLPFLLGMGLQGLGMSALGAGIATGIGTAAITGDLGKGALAGLGAFGGAGIGEGLGAASAPPLPVGEGFASASQAANASQAASALPPVSPTMVTPTVTDVGLGTGGFGGTTLPGGGMVSPTSFPAGTTPSLSIPGGFATPPGIENTALQMPSFQTTVGGNASNLSTVPEPSLIGGLKNVMSGGAEGTAAREAFMGEVGGGSGLLKYTAAGIAPYAFEQPGLEGMDKQTSLIRPYDYDTSTREFTARSPYVAPGPEYKSIQTMAQGGLTGYKEGNMLRGQGDGMSDEIQASIGGEQDVLLSDGEYVIPADAVAMLGNGSTDAGANRLDEMITRLRMKKYGRDKQPPEMKAEKVMPV
jgi:hypothetical protein